MASQTDIRECEVPYFTGRSAEEAEDFIQAVNRHAYAAGKQKDNAWIAEFVASLFSRRALRWHEELDEGTKNDWKLLKQAILAEFTGRQPGASSVPHAAPARASSSSNLTPAEPPPDAKIGYIRVESEDMGPVGYLFFTDSWLFPGLATISNDRDFATIFEADMSRNALRLQGSEDDLAVNACLDDWPLMLETDHYGCIVKSSVELGTRWEYAWSITDGGEITVSLVRSDGTQYDAVILGEAPCSCGFLRIPADNETFRRVYGKSYKPLTLHFESIDREASQRNATGASPETSVKRGLISWIQSVTGWSK